MRFSEDVPDKAVTSAVNEMRREVETVMEWFDISKRSLDLIKTSSERQLSEDEAHTVARDFLTAGLLMHSMVARNDAIVRSAHQHIAQTVAPDIVAMLDDMLKRAAPEM